MRTLVFLAICLISISSYGQDWPALRGANGLGSANPSSILAEGGEVRLQTRWKKKIGSGYSSVVVAHGRVVTMYTDGTNDLLASFSASNGETVWALPIGPKFKGENGSFDGPLSTPAIKDGKIYAISPTGKILCVEADTGKEVWTKELVDDFGAVKPLYGFVTSPLITHETLVIQTGVEDKSLMGLDPATGESRWAVSTGQISSQTPHATQFNGEDVLLACGGKNFIGVNPKDGNVHFEIEHGGGNGSAMTPVPIGDDTYLLTLDDSFSKAFKLSQKADGGIDCTETWKTNSIKNTYNIPVLSDENIFAYSTRILTSVDPKTGRAHWKSRKPGDGFLIAIDNHLIINTKKGQLYIVKADQDGFKPIANLDVFDDLVWSVPAFSDNSIFTRSLGEIARVDMVPAATRNTAVAGTALPLGPKFSSFLKRIERADSPDERALEVETWLLQHTSFPVVEDDIVHFVHLGDQKDVALASDMFGARQEKPMVRVRDTKLHYYSMKLPRDQRANYVFFVNFKPTLDPHNPRVMTSSMYAGEMEFAVRLQGEPPLKMSWFAMPDWNEPAYFGHGTSKAKIVACEIEAESSSSPDAEDNAEPTKFQVCLPFGYDKNADARFPTIYMFNGSQALKLGDIADATGSSAIAPAIVVLMNGSGPTFGATLVEKIVPYIDENYRTINDLAKRMVAGFGFAGTDALLTAANSNVLFGVVACQSPLAFADAERAIIGSMEKVENPTTVHLQWGRFDMFNPDENWDLRTDTRKIYDSISKNEKIQLLGGMVNDSTDWSSWRNRYGVIFGLFQK